MKAESVDKYLNELFEALTQADEKDERREFMNALLRIVAMICFESKNPGRSYKIAAKVILEAMNETEEQVH